MVSDDSNLQKPEDSVAGHTGSWLRTGAVAGVSAIVGGLAAAWFYRKTLTRLRHAESEQQHTNFRTAQVPDDEI